MTCMAPRPICSHSCGGCHGSSGKVCTRAKLWFTNKTLAVPTASASSMAVGDVDVAAEEGVEWSPASGGNVPGVCVEDEDDVAKRAATVRLWARRARARYF